MDDFDLDTAILDKWVHESPFHGHHDPKRLAREVREAAYFEKVAEIDRLRVQLKNPSLAGTGLTDRERQKGRKILDRRRAIVDAIYFDRPSPEPEPTAEPDSEPEPEPTAVPVPTPLPISAREKARRQGLRHYRTGRRCKRGHLAERFVSNGACVSCLRLAWAESKRKHRPRQFDKTNTA